ncbi:MAG: DUF2309 family protein [Myxococcales bacterium]|nr:DUF2309 family protein [Myxococcales bacterium]
MRTEPSVEISLEELIEQLAHLLPAQGPLHVFVHHNTLHAFEDLAFDDALLVARDLFAAEPYLSEERFRGFLAAGRIEEREIEESLAAEPGLLSEQPIGGGVTRGDVARALIVRGARPFEGAQLDWWLSESDATERLRADVDAARFGVVRGSESERQLVARLWECCLAAQTRLPRSELREAASTSDVGWASGLLVLSAIDNEVQRQIHPTLISLCSAFLDQGVARWSMPERHRGFYHATRRLWEVGRPRGERWMRRAAVLFAEHERAERSVEQILVHSLEALSIPTTRWERELGRRVTSMRGWAGMMHQLSKRPDWALSRPPASGLLEFLAVRQLFERAVRETYRPSRRGGGRAQRLRLEYRGPSTTSERAFLLFELAQIFGWSPESVSALGADDLARLFETVGQCDATLRRRVFQRAYERHYRDQLLDALLQAAERRERAESETTSPSFQLVTCIDEREESLRRHIEEIDPSAETFGYAGFFGIAMHYRGAADSYGVPLCPVAIRPRHEVTEEALDPSENVGRLRSRLRRWLGRSAQGVHRHSRGAGLGALMAGALGVLAAIPLVSRVLFPRVTGALRRKTEHAMVQSSASELRLERDPADLPGPDGRLLGFTVDEMAAIVGNVLEEIGLRRSFAPIVVIMGHGSESLNNPHESAHDCGACGGARGGPNARAFAQMANDRRVRERLRERGIEIPKRTRFVGAYHNTASEEIEVFDPPRRGELASIDDSTDGSGYLFAEVHRVLEEARMRNAHERCRRFESAPLPLHLSLRAALHHVEERSEDLAQARPELGHATNAAAVIGRRELTRQLYLDRRVFLVSYDPREDAELTVLRRLLDAVIPVVAGINLEYYFSHVDPRGYGCGTKLPHNITGLFGVMDGHRSDLRTGLPWQMVDQHEAMRLVVVIEQPADRLASLLASDPPWKQLVVNQWIQLVALDIEARRTFVFEGGVFRELEPKRRRLAQRDRSSDWYHASRAHLAPAWIERRER